MPNHIRNLLYFHVKGGNTVHDIVRALGDVTTPVDFNRFIPEPDAIKNGGGGAGVNVFSETGWYGWRTKHWGTKWDAYGFHLTTDEDHEELMVQFDTAWNHPDPVIVAISQRFPKLQIGVAFADEDTGSNLEVYDIQDGKKSPMSVNERTSSTMLLARLIHGDAHLAEPVSNCFYVKKDMADVKEGTSAKEKPRPPASSSATTFAAPKSAKDGATAKRKRAAAPQAEKVKFKNETAGGAKK